MEEQALAQLLELGAVGAVLVLLIVYLFRLEKSHKEERREWRQNEDKKSVAFIEALKDNTKALADIKNNTESCKLRN